MTALGKPLVFCLKYMAEMQQLYEAPEYGHDEPDLSGLEDAEHVREMARSVGATAYEEAAEFLEHCGEGIERHFSGMGTVRVGTQAKRSQVVRKWDWYIKIHALSATSERFRCGVFISARKDLRIALGGEVCGMVIPYIWTIAGRKGENAVWKILEGRADSCAGGGLVEHRGTVALGRFPIRPHPPNSFDVDREPLVAEVVNTFARIGGERAAAIAKFVGANRRKRE